MVLLFQIHVLFIPILSLTAKCLKTVSLWIQGHSLGFFPEFPAVLVDSRFKRSISMYGIKLQLMISSQLTSQDLCVGTKLKMGELTPQCD